MVFLNIVSKKVVGMLCTHFLLSLLYNTVRGLMYVHVVRHTCYYYQSQHYPEYVLKSSTLA